MVYSRVVFIAPHQYLLISIRSLAAFLRILSCFSIAINESKCKIKKQRSATVFTDDVIICVSIALVNELPRATHTLSLSTSKQKHF